MAEISAHRAAKDVNGLSAPQVTPPAGIVFAIGWSLANSLDSNAVWWIDIDVTAFDHFDNQTAAHYRLSLGK